MINKENIPKGKFRAYYNDEYGCWIVTNDNGAEYTFTKKDTAKFIAESFSVFSKTGMTPEDLHRELNTKVKHNLTKHNINISLQKEIEQLQQERDELIKLQKENFGDATTTHLKLSKYVKSLTTQQEEKPFGHDAPYDPRAV